jgi:hypothetical protein
MSSSSGTASFEASSSVWGREKEGSEAEVGKRVVSKLNGERSKIDTNIRSKE